MPSLQRDDMYQTGLRDIAMLSATLS